MRYLLLSVLVVCVIGIMVPSAFADTPIKNGMWIMQKIDVSADIRTDDHSWTEQTFEQSLLRNLYGIESEYRLNNVESIKTEIIDVTENGCQSKIFLIEKNGHEEFIGEGSDFCKYSEEFRMLEIGDTFSYPWGRGTIAELRNELPMLDVKEFTTITVSGKKVDVINAYVKDFSADQTGSIKYEVELVIHKQTGVLLGYYYDTEARGDWNEWLNLEKTLDLIDVSHHFVEAVVEPEPKSEPTQTSGGCGAGTVLVDGVCELAPTQSKSSFMSIEPLYIIIGVVAIGGIIGAIAVAKRGSKTPKPPKQKPKEESPKEEPKEESPKEEPKKKETSAFCENCGASLNPKAKFCGSCGNQV